jgi:hypothetical protein
MGLNRVQTREDGQDECGWESKTPVTLSLLPSVLKCLTTTILPSIDVKIL